MDRRAPVNHHENGLIDSDPESDILSEEILAQLVNDDEHSWLTPGLIKSTNGVNNNNHCNGNSNEVKNNHSNNNENGLCDNGGDGDNSLGPYNDNVAGEQQQQRQINGKNDPELKEWLSNVLENEAYKSTKDNLVRELDNLAVLHKLESSTKANKFGRMAMPVKNLETRWESRLEYNKEAKLDTRTITKRKPTFFNRFLSSEELSPSYGNLRNTKLNYSSSNISGSNSKLNYLGGSKNDLESPYTMRKSRLNNTFTMDEDDNKDDHHNESFTITRRDQNPQQYQQLQQLQQPQQHYKPPLNYNHNQLQYVQQRDRQYQPNTATVTRSVNGGVSNRSTVDQPVKKKPISMYSVYAEPTDSRPIRSSNTNVLSAYRLFKSSALNRQVKSMVPRRS